MSGTPLMKITLIIICINILLYIGGVRIIDSSTSNVEMLLNTDTNSSMGSNITSVKDSMTSFSSGGVTGSFWLIDAINAVKSFIIFMVNISFTPFGLFIIIPNNFGLIVGVPLTIAYLLGVAYFIRSGG